MTAGPSRGRPWGLSPARRGRTARPSGIVGSVPFLVLLVVVSGWGVPAEVHGPAPGSSPSPAAPPLPPGVGPLSGPAGLDDWTTYGADSQRSGFNPNETILSPRDAARLQLAWTTELNRTLLGSLIVSNDTVYVGDRSGYLIAMNASSGALLTPASSHPWSTPFLGNTSYSECSGSIVTRTVGIIATPTLRGNRLYENGGNTWFYTLSLNGQILQHVDIGNHTSAASPWYSDYNWESPLIYRDSAYLGVAALCEFNATSNSSDWRYVQGQLVEVNLTTGSVAAVWNVTKGTSVTDLGGSIWSTPAVDPATNTVWVTTGNMNGSSETPANGEYPQSMVALNATTLHFLGGCQVAAGVFDADYGAGPTLFHDAHGGRYVGAINKDGTFYAYNASVPSGGNCGNPGTGNLRLAWEDSFCTDGTPGTISPAAFDGTYLYVASDACSTGGVVDQIYPSNGTIRWSYTMSSPMAEAHAGVTVADGLVVVAANNVSTGNIGPGELVVLNASTGGLLYQHQFVAEANGWPVVAEGKIFVALGNASQTDPGWLVAFGLPPPPSYPVVFTETGLPSGTSWSVAINGSSRSSTTTTVAFTEPNGTYSYTVGPVAGWAPTPSSGTVPVSGANASASIRFTPVVPPLYPVTFTEVGLPTGTTWWVNITGGNSSSSTTSTLGFPERNGSYSYTVATSKKTFSSPGGSFVVVGGPQSETVYFTLVRYSVTFTESGLVTGTLWSISLGPATMASLTNNVTFRETNGSYPFSVNPVADYRANASAGAVDVSGGDSTRMISFTLLALSTYTVSFLETGLVLPGSPPMSGVRPLTWSVTLNHALQTTSTATLVFTGLANNSYPFEVSPVSGYTAHPGSGTIEVAGGNVSETIAFAPVPSSPSTTTVLGLPPAEGYALIGVLLAAMVTAGVVLVYRRTRAEVSRDREHRSP